MKTWKRRGNNTKAWKTRRERYGRLGSKNPERLLAHLRRNGKKRGDATPLEQLRRMGENSRTRENHVASQLSNQYDELFQPNEICDRVAVKDNTLIFIEIKGSVHSALRPKQQRFRQLCARLGLQYRVIIS